MCMFWFISLCFRFGFYLVKQGIKLIINICKLIAAKMGCLCSKQKADIEEGNSRTSGNTSKSNRNQPKYTSLEDSPENESRNQPRGGGRNNARVSPQQGQNTNSKPTTSRPPTNLTGTTPKLKKSQVENRTSRVNIPTHNISPDREIDLFSPSKNKLKQSPIVQPKARGRMQDRSEDLQHENRKVQQLNIKEKHPKVSVPSRTNVTMQQRPKKNPQAKPQEPIQLSNLNKSNAITSGGFSKSKSDPSPKEDTHFYTKPLQNKSNHPMKNPLASIQRQIVPEIPQIRKSAENKNNLDFESLFHDGFPMKPVINKSIRQKEETRKSGTEFSKNTPNVNQNVVKHSYRDQATLQDAQNQQYSGSSYSASTQEVQFARTKSNTTHDLQRIQQNPEVPNDQMQIKSDTNDLHAAISSEVKMPKAPSFVNNQSSIPHGHQEEEINTSFIQEQQREEQKPLDNASGIKNDSDKHSLKRTAANRIEESITHNRKTPRIDGPPAIPPTVKPEEEKSELKIINLQEHFDNDLDFNSLECSPDSMEYLEIIKGEAVKFIEAVESFSNTNYSIEYFLLDEKLMRLIERLDKIHCQADPERLKFKLETIEFINGLHETLDKNVIE